MKLNTTTLGRLGYVRSTCGLLAALIMAWVIFGQGLAHAEGQGAAPKVHPGRDQGSGDLFNLWHFDEQKN